jgi:hypothetical protein
MSKLLVLATILISPALTSSTVAQVPGAPAGGSDRNLRDSASDVKGRSNEMERIGRDAKKPDRIRESDKPDNPPASNFPEIKEDFERIQIINSDVLQANASGKPEYELISESAAEIHKRAIRLKSNLFSPKSKKQSKKQSKEEPGVEDQDLKSLLTLLDNSIGNFAHSPMFQNTKVVNPEETINAQKELDTVIKISARIRNEADRIKKANSTQN